MAYPDADLARSYDTTKATSGGFIELVGPNGTAFPFGILNAKRPRSTLLQKPNLFSASKMLRETLVPLQTLWSIMLQRPVRSIVHEDNQATITVINAGYSPQLRYLDKHHRVSLGVVHEMCQHDDNDVEHITTDKQKGDLMTKGLQRPKHEPAVRMVGLCPVIFVDH